MHSFRFVLASAYATFAASSSFGQLPIHFSLDNTGYTTVVTSTGTTQVEALVLTPASANYPAFGPLPAPDATSELMYLSPWLQAYTTEGAAALLDVDAICAGYAHRYRAASEPIPVDLYFSADRGSGGTTTRPPSIDSESSGLDAVGDIFLAVTSAVVPASPFVTGEHTMAFDGNGIRSTTGYVASGLGLKESPATGEAQDNVDAILINEQGFQYDRAFVSINESESSPMILGGGASISQVSGADILRVDLTTGVVTRYASAAQLGLDQQGFGTDELDALSIYENRFGAGDVFQPATRLFQWNHRKKSHLAGSADMVLFSVTADSAIIGQPDSIFGLPIMPGDILTVPTWTAPSSLGMDPNGNGNPGIFISAESLGLVTNRFPNPLGGAQPLGDLNGMGIGGAIPFIDCNGNGRHDNKDITEGYSSDGNMNGIPDECEEEEDGSWGCQGPSPCSNLVVSNMGCPSGDAGRDSEVIPYTGGQLHAIGSKSISNADEDSQFKLVAGNLDEWSYQNQSNALRNLHWSTSKLALPAAQGAGQLLLHEPNTINVALIVPTADPVWRSLVITDIAGWQSQGLHVMAGDSLYFQLEFPDFDSLCGTNTTNLTNTIKVTFEP